MARIRTMQRSPDLGLKIRMVKTVAPVVQAQADCCEPEIGSARWYNSVTKAYDLETVVTTLSNGTIVSGAIFSAQVVGDLCDATVTWEIIRQAINDEPFIATPGRGLAVAFSGDRLYAADVLTATATVTTRDGTTQILAPIYLIIVDPYYD